MNVFHERLRQERTNLGFTQREMAERLAIPLRTYINYEQKGTANRQPDFDMLVKIARLLEVSIDYLLGKED